MSRPRTPYPRPAPDCTEVVAELLALPEGGRWAMVAASPGLWRLEVARALLSEAKNRPAEAATEAEALAHLALAIAGRVSVEEDRVLARWVADLFAEIWAYLAETLAFSRRPRGGQLALELAVAAAELGTGAPEVQLQLLNGKAWLAWFTGQPATCLRAIEEAIAEAVGAGQRDWEASARWRKAAVLQALGRRGEAHQEVTVALALEIDLPEMREALERIYEETRGPQAAAAPN